MTAAARSYLYVPGDRPDRLVKALASGADAVIADLEDGVAPEAKELARVHVAEWLTEARAPGTGPARWVRVNPGETMRRDAAIAGNGGAAGIVLPKASIGTVREAAAAGLPVAPLLETATGILDAREIAATAGVSHLGLGEQDLGADLGVSPTAFAGALQAVRAQVVLASAAAGLPGPTGPVDVAVRDLAGLRQMTEALRDSGFGSRSCIHPSQVAIVNAVFTPTAEDIDTAEELLQAFKDSGEGVCVVDGRMVDEAVVRRARSVVQRAAR